MTHRLALGMVFLLAPLVGCYGGQRRVNVPPKDPTDVVAAVEKSDAQWRASLSPQQYAILRQGRSEPPFGGALWDVHEHGVYHCAGCGQVLFESSRKFDSGTGWPSFRAPVRQAALDTLPDDTLATLRTEVRCAACGGHLGHVFDDGEPNGPLRYCINSAALTFEATPDPAPGTGVLIHRPGPVR